MALAKDSPRLLKWVVLKPAEWLDERGVSISAEAYRDIFLDTRSGVLMEAIRHGDLASIQYRPAWLGKVVESFLRIRGDTLYERAKTWEATRTGAIADQLAAALGRRPEGAQPDPVRQLAQAASLLRRAPPVQNRSKAPAGPQLDLL